MPSTKVEASRHRCFGLTHSPLIALSLSSHDQCTLITLMWRSVGVQKNGAFLILPSGSHARLH
jgi:hypothetical protein